MGVEDFLTKHHIALRLQARVKQYLSTKYRERSKKKGLDATLNDLLNELPIDLRHDLEERLYVEKLTIHPFFKVVERQALSVICSECEQKVYVREEPVIKLQHVLDGFEFMVKGRLKPPVRLPQHNDMVQMLKLATVRNERKRTSAIELSVPNFILSPAWFGDGVVFGPNALATEKQDELRGRFYQRRAWLAAEYTEVLSARCATRARRRGACTTSSPSTSSGT